MQANLQENDSGKDRLLLADLPDVLAQGLGYGVHGQRKKIA